MKDETRLVQLGRNAADFAATTTEVWDDASSQSGLQIATRSDGAADTGGKAAVALMKSQIRVENTLLYGRRVLNSGHRIFR